MKIDEPKTPWEEEQMELQNKEDDDDVEMEEQHNLMNRDEKVDKSLNQALHNK